MGRVVINDAEVQRLKAELGAAWQVDTAPRISAALVTHMPIDTANMVLETDIEPFTDSQGRPSIRATGKAFYTKYVDQGTGIFGPLGKYITPNAPKMYLSWVSRETGLRVYAKRVKGQPGQHFFRKALTDVFGPDSVVEHRFGRGGD